MKKAFTTILTFIIAIIGITIMVCGYYGEMIYIPDVTMGSEFEITLNAHGGTAYRWSYDISSLGVEYVSMDFVPQNDDVSWTGGGQVVYKFKAINEGDYKIKFKLSIPWESEPPIELKTYKIKVVAG